MTPDPALFSVILPANNEAGHIRACLSALLAQDAAAGPVQAIVAANACTDGTEDIVQAMVPDFAARGWDLTCLSIAAPGKTNALNRAEAAAAGALRAYLDADVVCDTGLFGQLRAALAADRPLYATGTLAIAPAASRFTRAYARFWAGLPFVQGGAVGAGLFAVNAAGRARWGAFPDIISDDTFVRLHFAPAERIEVPARYHWPMVEGFSRLVRVRRRQDAGVDELRARMPGLMENEAKAPLTAGRLLRLAGRHPAGFAAYMAVHLAVRTRPQEPGWSRGR
ncbi:glycosyltransferase involved in cell wall biosynthesis [Rhodovulum iodosum]|uniref:Glycosyltransferase involved in cell wall biosynthesis n=1 Tax=Rhodovulum iodosum TaxID=68291 RepID=A0ABV3XXW8_9RHOB|nr:glycosyltransferase [Rhodovulum robiginosum]RSK38883.1 glycosyltransferase [Rhodovulum robiginosum]